MKHEYVIADRNPFARYGAQYVEKDVPHFSLTKDRTRAVTFATFQEAMDAARDIVAKHPILGRLMVVG